MKATGRRPTRLPDEKLRDPLMKATEKVIAETVLGYYKRQPDEVMQLKRYRRLVEPRHMMHYFMTCNDTISLSRIGLHFSKDHTTVIHSRNVVENWMQFDREFRLRVIKIADSIIKNSMRKRVQLIGKVSGLERGEVIRKFYYHKLALESIGYEVWNPVEQVPEDATQEQAMRICLTNLIDPHTTHVSLQSDYTDSPGGMVEYAVAKSIGLIFVP